jgi:hypothetical protein
MVLLGLAWPARQMLIAVGRPYRLALATLVGLWLSAEAGIVGAARAGIVGVAWGMTIGYSAVYLATSATALGRPLGWRPWLVHQARLAVILGGYGAAAIISAHVPLPFPHGLDWIARCAILGILGLPPLFLWARHHGWAGVFEKRSREFERANAR